MRHERNNLKNQERGERPGRQGQELLETDLNQQPNVEEVGLDRDLEREGMPQRESERSLEQERLTERPERGL